MKVATTKKVKKESDTEMLARLMVQGFDGIDKKFEKVNKRFDGMDKRFDGMDKRFDGIDKRLDGMDKRFDSIETNVSHIQQEVVAINLAQDETNRRLNSIERKQSGLLQSVDETVHKKEFQVLVSRVRVLEGRR